MPNAAKKTGYKQDAPAEPRVVDPIRAAVGKRLRDAREVHTTRGGLSAELIAARLGKSDRRAVYAWEQGVGAPDIYVLRSLCRLYGVTAESILWGDDDAEAPLGGAISREMMAAIVALPPKYKARLRDSIASRLVELQADMSDKGEAPGPKTSVSDRGDRFRDFPKPPSAAPGKTRGREKKPGGGGRARS
jgi:transcriptional regulator with XRE-family HTH domain